MANRAKIHAPVLGQNFPKHALVPGQRSIGWRRGAASHIYPLLGQWMRGLNWANLEGTWHELAVKKTLELRSASQHRLSIDCNEIENDMIFLSFHV